MDFTQERIIKRFEYNPETGAIIRKRSKKEVTSKDKDGYIVVSDFEFGRNDRMRGARLVWVMHHGDVPAGMIVDHKDRNRTNNRLDNLRLATVQENTVNAKRHEDIYTSQYKGVQLDKWGRWVSSIQTDRVTTLLGLFDSEEAAAYAYNVEADKRYGEFAVLNDVPAVDLLEHVSKRNRGVITEERRGLPRGIVFTNNVWALRDNGLVVGSFAVENKETAVDFAKHYWATGEVKDVRENLRFYNRHGLPYNIFPCSTGYRASFIKDETRYHVGTFKTEDDAVKALHKKQDEVGYIRKEL